MDIFPNKTPSELESEIIECPICLESFGINENRPYCLSNCCHKFHQRCILKVLEKEEEKAEDDRARIKVTVPCPMCKEPVKRKHVKLDTVFSRILDNSVKYYSQFYTPLRMPTIEEYKAAVAEFKKIIDCVCDIQDELIKEFEAEMAFMKKKTMINRICIGGEAVGIVVSIFQPIAGAIIIAGSNGIRLGANLYQVHLKLKRRKKIESLLMRKRECYQVDRIQKFLTCLRRLSSREIEIATQNTKVMAALTGGTVLAIVIEEAVVPLNLLTAAISAGVGVGLGVISLAANITISAVEKRNFDKQTQTYESFIKALKQEKEGITHHYKELVKNFDT